MGVHQLVMRLFRSKESILVKVALMHSAKTQLLILLNAPALSLKPGVIHQPNASALTLPTRFMKTAVASHVMQPSTLKEKKQNQPLNASA